MQEGTYQFGEFSLDVSRFQLRRNDQELRLEKKPMELLLLLAGSGGRLVTRAEIATHLWGKEVFVDTEHGINTAMRKVRAALGETPEAPRFVQTVPGMGYRFLGATKTGPPSWSPEQATTSAAVLVPALDVPAPDVPVSGDATAVAQERSRSGPRRWGAITAFCLLLVGLGWSAVRMHRTSEAAESRAAATGRDVGAGSLAMRDTGAAPSGVPEEAREQCRRGLYLLDRRSVAGSIAAFRRAIELAPAYAPAYAGLAEALDGQAKLSDGVPGTAVPEGITAARQAIALDPNFDGGYVALGMLQTAFTWEWTDAERNLKRGLQLNPHNAGGRIWYAVLLQGTGRQQQALEQARLAVEAEPLSFFMARMQGSVFYFAHRYDEAMRALTRAEEMTPEHPNVVDNWIAWVEEQQGLYDDAVKHDMLALQQSLSPPEIANLRRAYRQTGWKGYWRARLETMPPASQIGCRRYTAGLAALRTGDRDLALQSLRQAAEEHCFWLGMVHTDPALDSLRGDPRFREIERVVDSSAPNPAAQSPSSGEHL